MIWIAAAVIASTPLTQAKVELKVMTYNVRYATAPDGPNAWPHRRQALLALIKKHDPDVLGVQEALFSQIDEIQATLPDHERVGVGRDNGLRKGEYSALFTRRSKMGLREGGTRWISDEPLKPGSLAPGAHITRVFAWGEYFLAGGRRVLIMGCHLDHESNEARLMGARHMRAFAEARPDLPCIILGDFNCSFSDPPIDAMLAGDKFSACKPATGPFGTFTAFKPEDVNGPMIDHIFIDNRWRMVGAEIDRTLVEGRTPSDHFPVVAICEL